MTPLAPLEAARQFITRISKPARILVAISGGSDSTGLLLALHRVVGELGRTDIALAAVTIDHALRAESAQEAIGVAAMCRKLDIPHHIRRWNEAKPATGVSAAARLARYALISQVAETVKADMIVVGHTLGDQQETIAMRGARSLRPDNLGLAGMAEGVLYRCNHWFMRPFLNTSRQAIRDFLQDEGWSWFDDPSNIDARYERVRARNALEPASTKSGEGLSLTDRSGERAALSAAAADFIDTHVRCYLNGLIRISPEGLLQDPTVLRAALSAMACVLGGRRFAMASDSMDRIMALVASGQPGRATASRVVFDRRRQGLYLMRENRNIPSITIADGQKAVWDERFEMVNLSARELVVGPMSTHAVAALVPTFAADIPQGVAKRAAQSLAAISLPGLDEPVAADDHFTIRPVLAPYDLFLPRFDLPLANAIARLFGREAYPQPAV